MQPLFSIVIANYNFGRFLGDAIQSILDQKLGADVEVIICDGGSTDDSVAVIQRFAGGLSPDTQRTAEEAQAAGSNITWWCSEKDAGQSAAFNKGFSHAHGRFLTWLNADDVLTPGALSSVATKIQRNPRCEWFVGSSLWTDEALKVKKCFCAHRFSWLRARWGFVCVGSPSSFFTKRLLDSVGGVDDTLHYVMDTDLWHKFINAGARYKRTRHNVFAYRQHEASKMSGADEHTTARALENRRRAIAESEILSERYGCRGGWKYKLAQWLSVSVIDNVIAHWRTFNWKSKYATEIT